MPADTTLTGALPHREPLSKVIIAATIGNVLEWFDFLVYGYFAVTIAEVFFPTGNFFDRLAADHLRHVRPFVSGAPVGGSRHRHLYRPRRP